MTRRRWQLGLDLVVLILLLPALWNLAATARLHRQNPVPGHLYNVGGYDMHIDCTGSGTPTVLLEAAASASWMAWRRMQPELSKQTQVCSYDRAGHGWSDVRPGPRDAEHVVGELHALLEQARIDGPLILVGHSAGGLYVREYAREFPSHVAGVALLDASSPQQLAQQPEWRAEYERSLRDQPSRLWKERLRVWSGWERLTGGCSMGDDNEPALFVGQYAAMLCRPAFVGGEDLEYPDFAATSQQAARLTSFGKLPLLIISRDPAAETDTSSRVQRAERVWSQEQEDQKMLSPLSWRIIAKGAGHGVHHDRLSLVVEELQMLLAFVRGGPPPSFGTTTQQ